MGILVRTYTWHEVSNYVRTYVCTYVNARVRTYVRMLPAPAKAAADPAITALIPHRSGIAKQRTGTDHRAVCDDTHWPQSCVREVVLADSSSQQRTRKIIGGLVLAVVICRDINNRYVPPSLGLCARAKVSARARPVSRAKDSTRPL